MICNFTVNVKDIKGKQRETGENKETNCKNDHIALYFDGWYTAGGMSAAQPDKSA